MPYRVCLAALFFLTACGSGSEEEARLVLVNRVWERVKVQLVLTKSSDCNNRGAGFVSEKEIELGKNQTYSIPAPNGESVCWRHERNPNNPVAGVWSGWSRAVLFPGQTTETDL